MSGQGGPGRSPARALLTVIEGQKLLMEHIRMGTELVLRNSTAPVPAAVTS